MPAIDVVAELFGLPPDAPHLLVALTHPSFTHERLGPGPNNQRLEFLGDAVLGFISSQLLFEKLNGDEGLLTRTRAQLVNAEALAAWGRAHELPEALRLGRGARSAGLANATNVVADAVEALIAASYLDSGLDTARQVVESIVEYGLAHQGETGARDPKSALQEQTQALGLQAPTYRVHDSGGPAHRRWFEIEAMLGERVISAGKGFSKREAERAAAQQALDECSYLPSTEEDGTHD